MHPTLACFVFAVFCVSVVATKILRLTLNAHSFSAIAYLVYLPVLVVPDVLLACAEWLLLRRKNGLVSLLAFVAGCLIRQVRTCHARPATR